MTITRVGSNSKYAEGWDRAFGGKKKTAKAKTEPEKAKKKEPAAKKKAASKKAKQPKKA